MNTMTFLKHTPTLAVVRLAAAAVVPPWVGGDFVSVTRTANELSIVCDAAAVPVELWDGDPWVRFEVAGPLDLTMTGVIADIATCLAAAEIPVFTIATYDTDHVLVRKKHADRATIALRAAGNLVR
ncbi:MAG: ACT domain-containing protein [Actinobacteria bacterium]|nr:ACT domain-containing protein [Actinomycetota bacterium]